MVVKNKIFDAELIPTNYESWRYCIQVKCGLTLSPEFAKERIAVLGDPNNAEMRRFAKLYGDPYREQVLEWFRLAAGNTK